MTTPFLAEIEVIAGTTAFNIAGGAIRIRPIGVDDIGVRPATLDEAVDIVLRYPRSLLAPAER